MTPDKEQLIEAMNAIPMIDKWIKAVKQLIRDMLEKDELSLEGDYKLKRSGSSTTYDKGAVKSLLDSDQLSIEELLPLVRLNEAALSQYWSEKFSVSRKEARTQFRQVMEGHVSTKPKSPSIYRTNK
jgi:hypothetical protein